MRVRRTTFILAALTLALLPCASAQIQVSATVTAVTARQTVSIAVRLVNPDPSPRDVELQLTLPTGWQALIPPLTRTLAPGEDTVEVVVVRVPRSARAGTHIVAVTVDGMRAEAGVDVPQHDGVNLQALASTVTDGQVEASFQVRNEGNAPARVELKAVGQGKPRVTPATLDLAPGEFRNVQVTGPVPPELTKYSVTVSARTPGAAAQASISADVLTAAPDARSAWQTLPAEVQIEAGQEGPRIRFLAQGTVAPGVNVRLRAEPDVLEAELRTPGVHLILGPATPGFSHFGVRPPTLALQGELGSGRADSNTIRAYFGVRRDLQGQSVAGIELARRYGWGDARVGVDMANGAATATLAARAVTTQMTAQGELGMRRDGIALAVSADSSLKDNPLKLTRAGGSVLYRSPGFDSGPSGRVDLEVRTLARVNEFSVGASLRGGAELATGHTITGKDAAFGVQAQGPQMNLHAGVKWAERLDSQASTLTAGVGVIYQSRWGQLEQEVTNEQAFQISTRVANALRYSVSLEHPFGTELNTFVVKPQVNVTFDLLHGKSRVGASMNGSWLGPNGTHVNASVSQPDFSQRGLYLNAAVEHPLANGTTLLGSISQSFGAVSSTVLRVAARIPFDLPLYVRPDMGSLEGRVLDKQGKGVSGVTVQVMSYLAVTDPQGMYRFPALPQGDPLVVLRAPKGQWCTPPGTVPVHVRAVTRRDLTCVPSAQITARLVSHPVGEPLETPLEVSGVRITLKGPLGQFEATSDSLGRLNFEDLPASTYQLEVTPPAGTQFRNLIIEVPSTVDLTAGAAELTLRFGRRPRVIQMQDEQPMVVPTPSSPSAPATNSSGTP